eukprot:3113800-Amphidinium_carterae.1
MSSSSKRFANLLCVPCLETNECLDTQSLAGARKRDYVALPTLALWWGGSSLLSTHGALLWPVGGIF